MYDDPTVPDKREPDRLRDSVWDEKLDELRKSVDAAFFEATLADIRLDGDCASELLEIARRAIDRALEF